MTPLITKQLVQKILEKPLIHAWSLQGFGMLRLYLSKEVRLHVWSNAHQYRPRPDMIHDHPWGFLSWVVAGSILNVRYGLRFSGTRGFGGNGGNAGLCFGGGGGGGGGGVGPINTGFSGGNASPFFYGAGGGGAATGSTADLKPNFTMRTIKCGPGGCKKPGEEKVFLFADKVECVESGFSYSQRADEIHESIPADGTVSIIERKFSEDTEHARVFSPIGERWVSAEPRIATPQEVSDICKNSLERFF